MQFFNSCFEFIPSGGMSLRLQGPENARERRVDIVGKIPIKDAAQADELDVLMSRLLFSDAGALLSKGSPRTSKIYFRKHHLAVSTAIPLERYDDPDAQFHFDAVEIKCKGIEPANGEDTHANMKVTLTFEPTGHSILAMLWDRLDEPWYMMAREAIEDPDVASERREKNKIEEQGQGRLFDGSTKVTLSGGGQSVTFTSKKLNEVAEQLTKKAMKAK